MPSRPLTTSHLSLLCLLSLRPWSAYELVGQMRRSLDLIWPRAQSNLYADHKRLAETGLATRQVEAALGPIHEDVLELLELLDHLQYCDIGDWSRSIPIKTRLLERHETMLGADHPDLAHDIRGLAQAHDLSAYQSSDDRNKREHIKHAARYDGAVLDALDRGTPTTRNVITPDVMRDLAESGLARVAR